MAEGGNSNTSIHRKGSQKGYRDKPTSPGIEEASTEKRLLVEPAGRKRATGQNINTTPMNPHKKVRTRTKKTESCEEDNLELQSVRDGS